MPQQNKQNRIHSLGKRPLSSSSQDRRVYSCAGLVIARVVVRGVEIETATTRFPFIPPLSMQARPRLPPPPPPMPTELARFCT